MALFSVHYSAWLFFHIMVQNSSADRVGCVTILLSIMVVLIVAIGWLGICIMVGWCSVLLIGWGWCGYGNMFLYRFDICMLLFRAFTYVCSPRCVDLVATQPGLCHEGLAEMHATHCTLWIVTIGDLCMCLVIAIISTFLFMHRLT